MKLKHVFCLMIALCVLFVSSCVRVDEKVITGDVKDDETPAHAVDEGLFGDDTAVEPSTTPENVPRSNPVEDAASAMGAEIVTEKGDFFDDANSFLYSLMDKDYATLCSFTGGEEKAYNFLDAVDIIDFELYPLKFADEKLSVLENKGIYPDFETCCLANILVKSSDSDAFVAGDNYYFLGFTESSPIEYELCAFVPYDKVETYAFTDTNSDAVTTFIREFVSLYGENLTAGRNYPDSFDFSSSSHLVTHLMAENGYGFPPYSLDVINEFISCCFDSAPLLGYDDVNSDEWLYPVYTDAPDGDKLYGCSYAHGGYTVEHTVTAIETDGEDVTCEVEVFADYSHFAMAFKLRMNFVCREGEPPMLMMVSVNDVSGAHPVAVSL